MSFLGDVAQSTIGSTPLGMAGSFASSLGQGVADMIFGGVQAQRQWKYKQKEMALQQQYALEQMQKQYSSMLDNQKAMFDYENKYNDPTSIMQRFGAAGISPSAVLGSTGAQVGATISPSGGGSSNVSTPHAGSYLSNLSSASSAASGVQVAMMGSQKALIDSEVNKNNADADRARGETHSQDYRRRMDDLDLEVRGKESKILDSEDAIQSAIAEITSNDATVSTWTLGQKIDATLAQLQADVEKMKQLRIQTPYYEMQLQAGIALDLAHVFLSSSQSRYFENLAGLTYQQTIDLKNTIANNWDKKFSVMVTGKDGKSRTEQWSMQDFFNKYQQNMTEASFYEPAKADYEAHNERTRNRVTIFKSVIDGLFHIAGLGVGGAMAGAASRAGRSSGSVTRREHYDGSGRYIGGTLVDRRNLY